MSVVDWDERVKVHLLELTDIRSRGPISVVKWDGLSLAEAVERCMGLPPDERLKAGILASSGYYDGMDIEALAYRADFPDVGDGIN
jgi:hypothetical protein